MRGKPGGFLNSASVIGNIPAYAGKTFPLSYRIRLIRGTSPRMRGKQTRQIRPIRIRRNIPAYAGKTGVVPRLITSAAEHPRVCGENYRRHDRRHCWRGTSPRMRGKRFRVVEYLRPDRNIPAYAGKTSHGTACGLLPCGTSPRMRGKPQATPPTARTTGNIPAYAGKTLWHAPGVGDTWEHPRVCGENYH